MHPSTVADREYASLNADNQLMRHVMGPDSSRPRNRAVEWNRSVSLVNPVSMRVGYYGPSNGIPESLPLQVMSLEEREPSSFGSLHHRQISGSNAVAQTPAVLASPRTREQDATGSMVGTADFENGTSELCTSAVLTLSPPERHLRRATPVEMKNTPKRSKQNDPRSNNKPHLTQSKTICHLAINLNNKKKSIMQLT